MILFHKKEAAKDGLTVQKANAGSDRLIIITIAALLAAVVAVGVTFNRVIVNYRTTTVSESVSHLTEINQELQRYIESKIEEDWNTTSSIANSLNSMDNPSDDDLLAFLGREKSIWNVDNITLYTANGVAVNADGTVPANDVASETVTAARRSGSYMTINDSTIIYVIMINSSVCYHDLPVVAVAVVQDLSSFLDNMNISSFDGAAYLYLTQADGTVVSKMSHQSAAGVYNIVPLLQKSVLEPLSDSSTDDMLTSSGSAVFLRQLDNGDQYVVCTPVQTGYEQMRLFYFVPVQAVNQTTDSFSSSIVLLSIVVISAFSVGAILLFLFLYRTRKKQFNQAIAVREHMLDLLVQNSKSAFALLTVSQSEPLFCSSNVEKIIGEPFCNLKKTAEGYQVTTSSTAAKETISNINAQLKDWDGRTEFRSAFIRNPAARQPSYFEVQIFPVEDSQLRDSYIAIAQDVTPLYNRQQAVAEALAMAEQANQAKTRFLSNMSHDIRTPMNAIVNMTEFARESIGQPDQQLVYLNNLSESAAHLLQLINDVLDMSRIESGKLVVASAPFNMRDELERIADIVRPLCAVKNQHFETDFTAISNTAVLGDQVKLSQILLNLLSNANKFTPDGGSIRFTAAALTALRENLVNVRFEVSDSGVGIAEENQKRIFEPFARVDDEKTSKVEGTGLGLSICHSYVAAMGGTISCRSELDKGSTFTVELFFRKSEAAVSAGGPDETVSGTPFASRRCLLCEDNKINQTIAAKLLTQLGFAVETAADGRQGTEMFIRSAPDYYDVIYMDIQMPVVNGYEAVRIIRQSSHPQALTIPVIAMTADVFTKDIEKARTAGMNGHLGKPLLKNELYQTTERILGSKGDSYEKGS